MSRKILMVLVVCGLLLSIASVSAQDAITLTILTHWGEEGLLAGQNAMFDEYMAANPNVKIELITVPFEELLTKIVTGRTAGTAPDIYHLYNLWLPDFTGEGGMLAAPPEDLVKEITANTSQGVVDGITSNGQVWGYPTEVNTYLLLYNKRLLSEAGYDAPPATWSELEEIAAKITRKDDTGAVTQVGFGVLPGWDSGIVHPFSALLLSNGGQYLTSDFTATSFNSQQGQETLQLYTNLLENGGMDMSVSGWDFPNGKVGMVVMANWWRATLQASESIKYDSEVGVAPIPVGPSGDESKTFSYNWLWSVDTGSPNQEAAWKLIQWMNSEKEAGKGSPMGDYLVHALGAIPSMLYDQAAFSSDLSDFFLSAYVASTEVASPEPVVAGGQEVKTKLQTEIEAVLNGLEDGQTALETAALEGDSILAEKAGG